jgi:hypothetical protein
MIRNSRRMRKHDFRVSVVSESNNDAARHSHHRSSGLYTTVESLIVAPRYK